MYIKYERTDGGGDDKDGLVNEPPPWSARLLSATSLATSERHRARVEDAARPRAGSASAPSVLDRHPVLLQGVEASNRSRVHASSPIPLYQRYLEPVLGTVGGPWSSRSSRSKRSTGTVHTPLPVWGCLRYRSGGIITVPYTLKPLFQLNYLP